MLRTLRRSHQLSLLGRSLTCSSAALVNARVQSDNHEVPEGHKNSDLRSVACHIGLNRRRDLSLREDLCLFQPGGKKTVREIFKVKLVHEKVLYLGPNSRFDPSKRCRRVTSLVFLVYLTWAQPAQSSMCQATSIMYVQCISTHRLCASCVCKSFLGL